MNRVAITPRFEKSLSRLHPDVKKAAIKAIRTLMTNPESKGLNLESLGGRDSYSIRATKNYRILLLKVESESGPFYSVEDIGKHDIYRR